MGSAHDRRYERSWKLAATMLGLAAWVVAGGMVRLVEVAVPWELVVYVSVIVIVLVAGTIWLVPSRRRRS